MATLTQGQSYTDPAGRTGTVNYDTATGQPLAPGATTLSTPNIPVGSVASTSPLNIGSTIPPQPNLAGGVVAGATSTSNDIQNYLNLQNTADITSQENQKNDVASQISALIGQDTGRGAEQLNQEQTTGATALKGQLADVNAQILAKTADYNAQNANYELGASSKGITSGIVTGHAAAVNRAAAADIGLLQAKALGLQGQYTAAQDAANRAVDLKYQDIESQITAKQNQLNLIKDTLTAAQTKQANAVQYALDKEKQDTADTKAVAMEVAKSGNATPEILDAISKSTNYQSALKAAGNSLVTSTNDIIKLENGSTVLVDKKTGNIIKYIGGSSTPQPPTTPIIRTVTTPDGKNAPVDSYTLSKNDDPYFIAQKNGIDMQKLKDLNPTIKDWNNLPVGAVLNVPSKNIGDGAITAVAGIPLVNFNYLTQGTSALTRMNATDRNRIMAESDAWLKSKGIDYSTFQSRYKAYNKVVEDNVARANNTTVYGGEVSGTVDQFVSDVGTDFGNLKAINLGDLWAGKQVNNPTAQKYAFDLITMRNDLAGYYAASRGKGEADDADKRSAELVIQDGINGKSATAFKQSINANEQKVTGVVNKAVDTANKQVWDLFGVGNQYQTKTAPVDPLVNIQTYGNAHPEQQAQLTQMKLDGISVEDISNWINQSK